MFAVVSHTPSDDINCPGIDVGPLAVTPADAVRAWKEHRLSAYELGGAKDPNWDAEQPDSYEGMIMDMADDLTSKADGPLPAYANGEEEQAYLVKIAPLPKILADEGKVLTRIGPDRGHIWVSQTMAQVPASTQVEGVTAQKQMDDFPTEEAALAAYPGATRNYPVAAAA